MAKVCFCIPVYRKPQPEFISSLEKSIPVVKEAGWEECSAWELGHAYVSYARALLIRKVIESKADQLVFLDDDVSHEPGDLLRLLETPGDIVAGTYRFKSPQEEYMGRLNKLDGAPVPSLAPNGCYEAFFVPAGFLKISRAAIDMMVERYPDLDFSRPTEEGRNYYDLFQHGVIKVNNEKTWFGEDYAFSLRANLMGLKTWLLPDLNLGHHGFHLDGVHVDYPGNFQKFLDSTTDEQRSPNSMGLKKIEELKVA